MEINGVEYSKQDLENFKNIGIKGLQAGQYAKQYLNNFKNTDIKGIQEDLLNEFRERINQSNRLIESFLIKILQDLNWILLPEDLLRRKMEEYNIVNCYQDPNLRFIGVSNNKKTTSITPKITNLGEIVDMEVFNKFWETKFILPKNLWNPTK